MCIVFVYVVEDGESPYKYIIGSNRDEHLNRPAVAASQWESEGNRFTFAGQDLKALGTWLGVRAEKLLLPVEQALRGSTPKPEQSKADFRFGVVTNHREAREDEDRDKPSRGHLIVDFLSSKSKSSPRSFSRKILQNETVQDRMDGFNLLLGDSQDIYYVSNRSGQTEPVRLTCGVHGMSNGLLDDDWPKVVLGKRRFKDVVENHLIAGGIASRTGEGHLIDDIFTIMEDDTKLLEASAFTGVFPRPIEEALSSIYVNPFPIQGSDYGTRSTAVILVRKDGTVAYSEKHVSPSRTVTVSRHNLIYNPAIQVHEH